MCGTVCTDDMLGGISNVLIGTVFELPTGMVLEASIELETIVEAPCGGFCPLSWLVVLTIVLVRCLLGICGLLFFIFPLRRFIYQNALETQKIYNFQTVLIKSFYYDTVPLGVPICLQ